jgi:hypothetical protein
MPRKKKQQVKVNDTASLECLMQETYNDACTQIFEAQKTINEMVNGADPEDVRDYSDIAGQRTNALKIKDSAIKIKLELAKLQNDILKHGGDIASGIKEHTNGQASVDDFEAVRNIIKQQRESKENSDEYKLD